MNSSKVFIPFFMHPRSEMDLTCLEKLRIPMISKKFQDLTGQRIFGGRLRELGLTKISHVGHKCVLLFLRNTLPFIDCIGGPSGILANALERMVKQRASISGRSLSLNGTLQHASRPLLYSIDFLHWLRVGGPNLAYYTGKFDFASTLYDFAAILIIFLAGNTPRA